MSPGGAFFQKLPGQFGCLIPVAWKGKVDPLIILTILFQTLKINIYHAEIRAAPHQALCGLSEDRALLCSREQEAGGPRAYPFRHRLDNGRLCSWEKQVCFKGQVGCYAGLF